MAYFTLILGLAITLYAAVALYRRTPVPVEEPGAESPEKEAVVSSAFTPLAAAPPDGTLVYELKEKVEEHLAELSKQKELITHLALRVEKKLEAAEERKFRGNPVPAAAGGEGSQTGVDSLERLRLFNDVYLMYDHGVPIAEIARQVERGKGEVELILGLRK